MEPTVRSQSIAPWARVSWIVSTLLFAGCSSSGVKSPLSENELTWPSVREATDQSWSTEAYMKLGMPDPDRFWNASDFRQCRDVLLWLDSTNHAALPRMGSSKSGAVFARMTNPTNTLLLGQAVGASEERIRDFIVILNRQPVLRDIYRFDAREPVFHRETIELNHSFLRMLGSAVEWDGKTLPPAPGEDRPATFRLMELSRTYKESFLNQSPAQSVVPRSNRLIVVGAYTVSTMGFLPWLADGTGLTEAERFTAIRYMREDLPMLWPHVSVKHQQELLGDLGEVLRRTQDGRIREELKALSLVLEELVTPGRN